MQQLSNLFSVQQSCSTIQGRSVGSVIHLPTTAGFDQDDPQRKPMLIIFLSHLANSVKQKTDGAPSV
jgi:hypothetical protein